MVHIEERPCSTGSLHILQVVVRIIVRVRFYHKCSRTSFARTSFLVYDSATNIARTLAPMPVTTRVGRKLGDSENPDFMTHVKLNFQNSTPPTMPTRNGYHEM